MRTILIILLAFFYGSVKSQNPDTISSRKNILKFNLSSHILYSTSFILSYERVINSRQTLGITAGYLEFPDILINDSLVAARNNISKSGYTLAAEYRFYLTKENKYKAPHGVFIGPYTSYYQFNNKRILTLFNNNVSTEGIFQTKINVLNLGLQLGYQFVIKDRWTLDFIFAGPSVSYYGANLKLHSNIELNENQENDIIKALINRFPFMGELINEDGVRLNTVNAKWSVGYRYLFQVGYKFGSGKKSR